MLPEGKKITIKEMHPLFGDKVTVITQERELQDLDYKTMVTVMPDGTRAESWDELLKLIQKTPTQEIEIMRFPLMVGG